MALAAEPHRIAALVAVDVVPVAPVVPVVAVAVAIMIVVVRRRDERSPRYSVVIGGLVEMSGPLSLRQLPGNLGLRTVRIENKNTRGDSPELVAR